MLLKISDVKAGYGDKQVLFGVSVGIEQGEIVSILGHNGAGKTTLLMTIYGLCDIIAGMIKFQGEMITGNQIHQNVKKGLVLVPDGHQVFGELSVSENLKLIKYLIKYEGYNVRLNEVFEIFPRLAERKTQVAHTLSGGEQQMLSMAMGLLMNPRLLMLDEPSLGLAPLMVKNIMKVIEVIKDDFGVSIFLVEQNLKNALSIASRVYLMKLGKIILEDSAEEFRKKGGYLDLF